MENKVTVPTDNIYKFYALFGLVLFVFSCTAVIHVNESTNELILKEAPEIVALKQIDKASPVENVRLAALERKVEIAKANKDFFLGVLVLLTAVSLCMMGYGFTKWHTEVQPFLDRSARVQLEIAELQLMKLRSELKTP